jgi:hypothetical protein
MCKVEIKIMGCKINKQIKEPILSELLGKSSAAVVFNDVFRFLREMRIMGRI